MGAWLEHFQRHVVFPIVFDQAFLHVQRQINQDRAGTSRTHDVKSLTKGPRHLRRLHDCSGPLGHRLRYGGDVDGLKIFFMQLVSGRLTGDAEDGQAVGKCGIQAGDHIGTGRAGSADHDTDLAVGAVVPFRAVGAALFMPDQYVFDLAFFHCIVQGQDRGTGNAEHEIHAFAL